MYSEKEKIKILLVAVCKPGAIGGQATSARLLLSGLKNEIDWTVVSLPSPGLNIVARVLSSLWIFLQSIFICLVKGISIAHIFTSCTRAALYEKLLLGFVLRLTGAKTVLNFRGAFDEFYLHCTSPEKKIIQFFLKRQSVVLCQHDGIKKFLVCEGIVPENRIRVIANAVEQFELMRKAETKTGMQKIFCLSWIVSSKGLDLLIEAAAEIKNELLQQKTVIEICGPEEEAGLKEKLQKKINSTGVNDVIYFLPPASREEKNKLLHEAEIFVLPTRREGFPNVLLEAMMAGLPVVTTNLFPMNDIVKDHQTGLLFERENKSDLAKKILVLLNDAHLRNRMGAEGRKRVLENYTPEIIMSRFLELYKELTS